ncbi:substrate-binding domain-containing protein [Mesorhizobium sp.]|uniref:sugar ABC transporter substrate-binding protein n=1 Tax=Mesorhizobium sp. TaxID=1871066 RepID=UPI000FE7E072|nr:substrate-binding domain-containing protein [Mesorhizobium sp.]RWB33266.1 MAG: ABC transporter substrate-binding protein [Mesorhizobium sp.]RWD48710.1 MAG: ABC transporter substrate-binding protein [Mesorhizobium sp.]TIV01355.1 MAG: ABC transporter substrate-binding protein [Mesorhizobium sp.]TKD45912.1 MAG: ABC transporter substrate-binding protein [Mesorhizobium sp.]
MLKFVSKIAVAATVLAGVTMGSALAQDAQKTFYLLSHGGPSDAFWLDWNAGATKACDQLKVTCNISFSGGDMAAQKEAFNSALAAEPDGIATTSAQPGLWTEEVKAAKAAGIPIVFFNTDDPATGRQAYVGADLKEAGAIWAKYLVDHKMVKQGDKVFLPVEVPGASYQQLETEGIASVFDPLGIKYDVVDCGTDPAGIIAKMTDYMVANNPPAIIALGDSVAASIKRVFDGAGVPAGKIPVVGWGNSKETAESVKAGFVNAAAWQFPSAQGFMPVALLGLAASGEPIGYDIHTFSLYDASSVEPILKLYNK